MIRLAGVPRLLPVWHDAYARVRDKISQSRLSRLAKDKEKTMKAAAPATVRKSAGLYCLTAIAARSPLFLLLKENGTPDATHWA